MSALLAIVLSTFGVTFFVDRISPPDNGITVICVRCKAVLHSGSSTEVHHSICEKCFDEMAVEEN